MKLSKAINYQEFETYLKSKNKRPDTIYNYAKRLKELPQELLHTPYELNYFLYHKWGKKPSVIDITTSAIRTYYKSIGKREWIELIEKPGHSSDEKTDYMTKTQIERFRAYLQSLKSPSMLHLIFDMYYETSIRRTILIELELKDIDFDKNTITIDKKYIGNKAKKTYLVYISDNLKNKILEYTKMREEGDLRVTDIFRYEIWIEKKKLNGYDKLFEFYYKRGDSLERHKNPRDFLTKLFIRLGDNAKVKLRPHIIRHTGGTETYSATKDIIATRDTLGQKTTKATERYIRTLEDLKNVHKKRFK